MVDHRTKDKHATGWSGDGRTLCGIVEEGDSVVGIMPPQFASKGQQVSCPDCSAIIGHVNGNYTLHGRRR